MKTRLLFLPVVLLVLTSCDSAVDPRAEAYAALPDWSGVWFAENLETDITGLGADILNPESGIESPWKLMDPAGPWSEAGRENLMQVFNSQGDRKTEGWGYPMMMNGHAPLQFVLTPDETVIINSYHEVRYVYTDGRPHPPEEDRWATTWGDSIGHWEGDTLVIDTVSVRNPTNFMFWAPPYSEQAHYIERLRKVGPDRIESEFTIEDPFNLDRPYVAKVAYIRTPTMDRLIQDSYVNDRSELENGVFGIEPSRE